MVKLLAVVVLASCASYARLPETERARRVTIVRDDWGIAHVHGKTDADAVFGMIYAQAEDDFPRIETNYLNALGRLAEAEGEPALWQDLRMKLFVDPVELAARYDASPPWLRVLMDAWADGLNYFLRTHPEVKPRVLTRFEPWMALAFTEGSIGGDIERVDLAELAAFYDGKRPAPTVAHHGSPLHRDDDPQQEPSGSNGFAIAPANTANRHALLLINPHTSFFFRSELQVTSDEGLDAYGAVTWGQFFVYQGFNRRLGWMHTSTTADAVDEYAETIVQRGDRLFYRYGKDLRPVTQRSVAVPYHTAQGEATRTFTVYATHHGPLVRSADGKWIAIRLMQKPIEALSQSYLRTKAHDLASFREVMALAANSSNNTVYADADGHIAYFHPQFVPRRDDRFDWTQPVDGSDPATEWHGVHAIADTPHVIDPPNGWLMNTNNGPYSAAGPNSPRRERFPRYMDTVGENPRGLHATRVLQARHDFTLGSLRDAAFDPYLPAFADLVPRVVAAYDVLPPGSAQRARLAAPLAALRTWDFRWSAASVPTSVAVYWGLALWPAALAEAKRAKTPIWDALGTMSADDKLAALDRAVAKLTADFGTWQTPWGEINRFQRRTADLVQQFDDAAPSIPVPFTSAQWGSLASFGAKAYPGTKKLYGTSGNSFVAVVELGPQVRARAITAGGESGHPDSPHFNDEAVRYAAGDLRDVYLTEADLAGHTKRTYHPGQ
jgi:acyl-homoserine-lactone acylase